VLRRFAAAVGITALLLLGLNAMPAAQAATCAAGADCDTTVTFTLTAGALTITVPDTAELTNFTASPFRWAYETLAGTPAIQVDDDRASETPGDANWTATVNSSSFTTGGPPATYTIPATDVFYHSGDATLGPVSNGTGTFTAGQADPLTTPTSTTSRASVPADWAALGGTDVTAFSHTGAASTGSNSVGWNPTIIVYVNGAPATPVTGSLYTGTITHSVT
jgi:hypothetical protein